MSAGGISYSGITNHGKITLPSVDSGFGSMNILRDPPKSLYTRQINKVGETSSITEMIDESSNRACEAILPFSRGINPFVSVSYDNNGNNGGSNGSIVGSNNGIQAKLPYTVMRDGAFRPPVLLQEDLLPLSRMPRNWTSAFSAPGFADFSKKMRTCGTAEETKEVKTDTLKASIRPTATYTIETPISEPFEIKYVIQPSLKTSANSGIRTMDITQRHVSAPTKEIETNPLHAHARTNIKSTKHVDNNVFDPQRYIQSTNPHYVNTNISTSLHHTSIEDLLDLSDMPIHDKLNFSVNAPLSGTEQTKYFHDDIELSRNVPSYQATTNIMDTNIHKRVERENDIQLSRNIPMGSFISNPVSRGIDDHNNSRTARLAPKISPGGYSVPSQVPMINRMQNEQILRESEKARMNRLVSESMLGRFNKSNPYAPNLAVY